MAEAIVAILNDGAVRIGTKTYLPNQKLSKKLMNVMVPELEEFLPPGESPDAGKIARAIRKLHLKAIHECVDEK